MKILVVDDEQSYGSLLGRTLKRLGHQPIIAAHPDDALQMLEEHTVDAVITDIDMPSMNGVELAQAIRGRAPAIPIAFCTGSNRDDVVVEAARQIGDVLPKVWTVADVKDVVTNLKLAGPRLARGSQTELPPIERRRRRPSTGPQTTRAKRSPNRKIKVSCRTWDQVDKLVDQHVQGRTTLTLRGSHRLKLREQLTVALSLPDELVLSIAAEVSSIRRDETGGGVFLIALVGMTADVCVRLRAMSEAASSGSRSRSRYAITGAGADVLADGTSDDVTEDGATEDSGSVVGNLRLRKQIETMAEKMRPSERDLRAALENRLKN